MTNYGTTKTMNDNSVDADILSLCSLSRILPSSQMLRRTISTQCLILHLHD